MSFGDKEIEFWGIQGGKFELCGYFTLQNVECVYWEVGEYTRICWDYLILLACAKKNFEETRTNYGRRKDGEKLEKLK